jgi:putative membrane protein
MKRILIRWLLTTAALILTVYFVPGMESAGEWWMIAGAAAALGLLNMLAAPIVLLIKLVTFPLSCLTFGLWTLLVSLLANIAIFQFVSHLEWGFTSEGFFPGAVGAVVMSLVTAILSAIFHIHRPRE